MNKIILLLVALFVVSTSGFALTGSKTADLSQKTASPVINIKIDLGDITNLTQSEVAALIDKNLESCIPDLPVLQCSVTVGATLNIGVFDFNISVTVSGDCSEVRNYGLQLARQIVADIKEQLENYFF